MKTNDTKHTNTYKQQTERENWELTPTQRKKRKHVEGAAERNVSFN